MTAAPVPTWLTDFAGEVTGRLRALAGGLSEALEPPVSALAGRPGKCFRAMLLCACAGLAGEARDRSSWPGRRDRLVRLGALVELLHLASLLHDDVVDRATTRRGGPAAHTVVGQERAVLAGLACFTLAGMEAASIGGGLDQIVGAAVAGLACGEVLDVERAFDTGMSVDDYLELAERKTGDLFRLSCLLGAAESGAGEAVTDALAKFGADLGVAFQVLDDCLDLRADPTDKPAGTDLLGKDGERNAQRRLPKLVLLIDLCALVHQVFDVLVDALIGGGVQRSPAELSGGIHVGAMLDEIPSLLGRQGPFFGLSCPLYVRTGA